MSESITFQDFAKSLPDVPDGYNRSIIVTDSNGNQGKIAAGKTGLTNLAAAESPGANLSVETFVEKYVYMKPVGHWLLDMNHANNLAWYVRLSDQIILNTQWYVAEVVKTSLALTSAWKAITVLFKPCSSSAQGFYLVTLSTGASAAERGKDIRYIPFTTVAS